MQLQYFHYPEPFLLESGLVLPEFHLAYSTFGVLNADKSNVVWVFHAFTADSNATEWWDGLIGEGTILNPDEYFIICVNMPGSCYGSIGPLSTSPGTGQPYWYDFPVWTVRDMARAYGKLKDSLQIQQIYLGIGGSMGGQQLLEWAIEEPELFEHICAVATNAVHSPWGIAFNATQRACITNDHSWGERHEKAGIGGMRAARALAILSYRNYNAFHQTQQGIAEHTQGLAIDKQVFNAETYQLYQGEKLAKRFNAFSYYFLSLSMDKHDLSRNRGSLEAALDRIKAKALIISMENDYLFPETEQLFLDRHIRNSEWLKIKTSFGHDGFLIESKTIASHLSRYLKRGDSNRGSDNIEEAGLLSSEAK